jgi:hypothetical protein
MATPAAIPTVSNPESASVAGAIPTSITVTVLHVWTDDYRRTNVNGWRGNDNPGRNNNYKGLRWIRLAIRVVSSVRVTIPVVWIRLTISVIVPIRIIWIRIILAVAIVVWIRLIIATVSIWVTVSGTVLTKTNGSNAKHQSYQNTTPSLYVHRRMSLCSCLLVRQIDNPRV